MGGRGKGGPVGGGGVRVDVNEEISFCENSKKKKKKIYIFFFGGVGWGGGCQIRGGVGEGVSRFGVGG